MILTVSCLASSALSTGNDRTAFSTLARMSSIGVDRGVTVQLRPFCSSEETPSSNFWSLRLMTVSFEVFELFNFISKCNRGSDNLYVDHSFMVILQKPYGYTASNRLVLMAAMLHCTYDKIVQTGYLQPTKSPDLCAQLL